MAKQYGNAHQQVEDYETITHNSCVLYNTSTVINKGYNHARLERPCSNRVLEKANNNKASIFKNLGSNFHFLFFLHTTVTTVNYTGLQG